jgi:hypothetical protein
MTARARIPRPARSRPRGSRGAGPRRRWMPPLSGSHTANLPGASRPGVRHARDTARQQPQRIRVRQGLRFRPRRSSSLRSIRRRVADDDSDIGTERRVLLGEAEPRAMRTGEPLSPSSFAATSAFPVVPMRASPLRLAPLGSLPECVCWRFLKVPVSGRGLWPGGSRCWCRGHGLDQLHVRPPILTWCTANVVLDEDATNIQSGVVGRAASGEVRVQSTRACL